MALLERKAVLPPPDLAREVVSVAALGGDVIVTELSLEDRLDVEQVLREMGKPSPAAAEGAAKPASRASVHAFVPQLLARAVVLEDGEPLFTLEQWRAFGARHRAAVIELFNAAMRLSGFNGDDTAKN